MQDDDPLPPVAEYTRTAVDVRFHTDPAAVTPCTLAEATVLKTVPVYRKPLHPQKWLAEHWLLLSGRRSTAEAEVLKGPTSKDAASRKTGAPRSD